MVSADQLAGDYPVLYHMAAAGSWPAIRTHGLVSTSALLDLFEIKGEQRQAIEARHRPECVTVTHPKHGTAIVRDQKPMDDRGLVRALQDGLTPAAWYRILNEKVFFWVRRERLETMMNARAYRDMPKTVIYVRTADLLAVHEPDVVLAAMNTGCTKPMPHPRGRDTFLPMAQYPYAERRRAKRGDAVVELAVTGAVTSIGDLAFRVEHIDPDAKTRSLCEPLP